MGKAAVVTGKELQELVLKAVGGIYFGETFCKFARITDISVNEEGLKVMWSKYTSSIIPINMEETYINYAIPGESEEDDEEWDGNPYFDYILDTEVCKIAFNVKEKPNCLTNEQFKALITKDCDCRRFDAQFQDSGAIQFDVYDCEISFNDEMKELYIGKVTIDMNIVESIENFTEDCGSVYYLINFNNGSPSLEIEPTDTMKALGVRNL